MKAKVVVYLNIIPHSFAGVKIKNLEATWPKVEWEPPSPSHIQTDRLRVVHVTE